MKCQFALNLLNMLEIEQFTKQYNTINTVIHHSGVSGTSVKDEIDVE